MDRVQLKTYFRNNFHLVTTLNSQSDIDNMYGSGFYYTNYYNTILNASYQNLTVPIYECQSYSTTFISNDRNCEGSTFLRLAGYLYKNPLVNMAPLYRCVTNINNDHWVSIGDANGNGPDCGYRSKAEGLLGFGLQNTFFTNRN